MKGNVSGRFFKLQATIGMTHNGYSVCRSRIGLGLAGSLSRVRIEAGDWRSRDATV